MKHWTAQYPPYAGTEPYIYLAFSGADADAVWPVMRALLRCGARVWYCTGDAGSAAELRRRQARAQEAKLTLVYLADASVSDRDTKSMVLVNQKNRSPVLALDSDGKDRLLAMGLLEHVPVFRLKEYRNPEDLEEGLIRAEGFTQELLGESVVVTESRKLRQLTAVFSILAAALLLLSFAGFRWLHWFRPGYEDTVLFSDSVLQTSARQAVGGGALTEESLAAVQTLVLAELPGSWDDLSLLPALEEIVLPQALLTASGSDTSAASLLPGGDYVVVLTQGGAT